MMFAEVERACLPTSAMGRLAALRCGEGVEIALHERNLWLRWNAGNDEVAQRLFAIVGCRLFAERDGRWYDWGKSVPAFDVPDALRFRPLSQVIFPATIQPMPADRFGPEPVPLTLAADPAFRPTTAVLGSLDAVWSWAETMPACALVRYRAAVDGQRLFVLGKKLPWIDGAARFWGRTVLAPLGFRPQPRLSETSLRTLAGVADSDLLVLRADGCDIIAQDHFTPLTHAALRLALRQTKGEVAT